MDRQALVQRAFEIADASMFELLQSECARCNDGGVLLGLLDESGHSVRSLCEASQAIQEAVEWLQERQYVELAEDADGEHVLVVRGPYEG